MMFLLLIAGLSPAFADESVDDGCNGTPGCTVIDGTNVTLRQVAEAAEKARSEADRANRRLDGLEPRVAVIENRLGLMNRRLDMLTCSQLRDELIRGENYLSDNSKQRDRQVKKCKDLNIDLSPYLSVTAPAPNSATTTATPGPQAVAPPAVPATPVASTEIPGEAVPGTLPLSESPETSGWTPHYEPVPYGAASFESGGVYRMGRFGEPVDGVAYQMAPNESWVGVFSLEAGGNYLGSSGKMNLGGRAFIGPNFGGGVFSGAEVVAGSYLSSDRNAKLRGTAGFAWDRVDFDYQPVRGTVGFDFSIEPLGHLNLVAFVKGMVGLDGDHGLYAGIAVRGTTF